MLQNITLSADKTLLERASKRAQSKKTTLNAEFRRWLVQYIESPQTEADLMAILNILQKTRYCFYDALILAGASQAGCNIVYSEDLRAGDKIEGVNIINPYQNQNS